MQKKIIYINICIMLIFFLTGCWDARELNELGISLIMGFDIEEDKILVTLEVVDPASTQKDGEGGEKSAVIYVQGIGNTIFEALRDISLKFDRRIFISHNKVIIFGEEFAKKGLVSQTDQLLRDREQRETAYMLITKGAKAYEVMGINNGLEDIPGNHILELVQNIRDNPKTVDVNIVQYLETYYLDERHTVAGVIEKIEKQEIDKTSKDTGSKRYELSVIGSAIFKDDILVGYLDGNDTKALNFLINNVNTGLITFPTPIETSQTETESNQSHRKLSSVLVTKVNTKIDVEVKEDSIILKSKIKIKGSVGEIIGNIDVYTEEGLKQLEKACSKTAEEAIELTVRKVQKELRLDIFGFGSVFHRKYPDEWRKIKNNWDEIFSEADYRIDVDTDIIRTGLINTPIFMKQGD